MMQFVRVQQLDVDRLLRPPPSRLAEPRPGRLGSPISTYIFHHPLKLFYIFYVERFGTPLGINNDTLRTIIVNSAVDKNVKLAVDAAEVTAQLHVRMYGQFRIVLLRLCERH
jgi:hypothetical protein